MNSLVHSGQEPSVPADQSSDVAAHPVTADLFTAETDPEGTSLGASLERVMAMSAERIARVQSEFAPTHTILTVSGGRDSAAETELALEMGIKPDFILHGRTGTGIRQTTEHVISHYGNLGPDLVIADAGDAYEQYVMRKGFFGIGKDAHNFSYHVLKAQPFRKAISKHIRQGRRDIRVMVLNGARMTESENRRINLPETKRDPASPGNLWVNLIHDWTDGDRDNYLRLRQTPINPVAVQLCRSGECMCGTQQTLQARAEAAALYPEWGNWLDDLEARAVAKHGWGWGVPMPRPADPNQVEMFSPMCMGCAREAAVRGEAVPA